MAAFGSIAMVIGFTVFILTIGKWIVDKIFLIADKFLSVGGLITIAVCLMFIKRCGYRISWCTRNIRCFFNGCCHRRFKIFS